MAKDDELVVEGATMKCTMGDKSTKIKVTSNSSYNIGGKKVATMMDVTPANLFPPLGTFGTCKPFKAVPPPGCLCTPVPAGPWAGAFAKKKTGGKSNIKADVTLMCSRGAGTITFQSSGQDKAKAKTYNVTCKECGKIHNPNHNEKGNHVGSGTRLGKRILREKYGGMRQSKHPLSEPGGKNHTAEAHHLITSECLDDNDWPKICKNFSYNIDCPENGIILPSVMRIACEKAVPLHRSSHADTMSIKTKETYIDSVKRMIKNIRDNAKAKPKPNEYCSGVKDIKKDMNEVSKSIWTKVKGSVFILTWDGHDYEAKKVGCKGHNSLRAKKKKKARPGLCINRTHPDKKHQARMAKAVVGSYFLEQ